MTLAALATIAITGLSIAFLHAAIPTHWLPFVLTSRALKWTNRKTLTITVIAAVGHAVCTSVLGFLLAWFGIAISHRLGAWFPRIAGGALLLVGLFYIYRQIVGGHGHFHLFGGHHEHSEPCSQPGPHGGVIMESHGSALELSICENDGPARFRLYQATSNGTPLPPPEPDEVALTITRSDRSKQTFSFKRKETFLESIETFNEPHDCTAILGVGHEDHSHEYSFTFKEDEHLDHATRRDPSTSKSDWAAIGSLFMLLTFSPCEGFLVVYLAGVKYGWAGFALLTAILALGTVAAMTTFTWIALLGSQRIKVNALERYESGILGTLLSLLGLFVILFDT